MSIPSNKPSTLDADIIRRNVSPSRVSYPQWTNNTTRLNATNMEAMRSNLIQYINLLARELYAELVANDNELITNSAGWVMFNDSKNIIGEIFNCSKDNINSVSENHQYQAAFGKATIANGEAQFVCGKYNEDVENALFVIGCGDSEEDRRNALIVQADGSIIITRPIEFNAGGSFRGTFTTEISSEFIFNGTLIVNGDAEFNSKLRVTKAPTSMTEVVRKKELDALRAEISGALHYIGVTDHEPKNDTKLGIFEMNETTGTYTLVQRDVSAGDIVLVGSINNNAIESTGVEYIFNGDTWTNYGAYANYVPLMQYEEDMSNEREIRSDMDKKLYGGDIPEKNNISLTGIHSSMGQEASARKGSDKYITGLTEDVPTSGFYADSNTNLRSSITSIQSDIEKLTDRDVIVSNPSVSIKTAMYGSTTYPNPYYIPVSSTEQQLPSIYLNFDPGKYKYGPDTGIKLTSIKAYDADTNTLISTATNTSVDVNMITMPKKVIEEKTYKYKFVCEHNAGSIPKTNLNREQLDKQIQAGTIQTEDLFTVIGYYEGCYYGATTSTDISQYVVDQLLNKSGKPYVSKALTITVSAGSKSVIVACPSNKTGLTKVYNKTVNALMTPLFIKRGSTMTLNGIPYNVWVYQPATEYTQEATLEITLG